MANPFKKLKKVGTALKIGYSVLKKYEALEQLGIVPELKIKGVPVTAIDKAAQSFVNEVKKAKKAEDAEKAKVVVMPDPVVPPFGVNGPGSE